MWPMRGQWRCKLPPFQPTGSAGCGHKISTSALLWQALLQAPLRHRLYTSARYRWKRHVWSKNYRCAFISTIMICCAWVIGMFSIQKCVRLWAQIIIRHICKCSKEQQPTSPHWGKSLPILFRTPISTCLELFITLSQRVVMENWRLLGVGEGNGGFETGVYQCSEGNWVNIYLSARALKVCHLIRRSILAFPEHKILKFLGFHHVKWRKSLSPSVKSAWIPPPSGTCLVALSVCSTGSLLVT